MVRTAVEGVQPALAHIVATVEALLSAAEAAGGPPDSRKTDHHSDGSNLPEFPPPRNWSVTFRAGCIPQQKLGSGILKITLTLARILTLSKFIFFPLRRQPTTSRMGVQKA